MVSRYATGRLSAERGQRLSAAIKDGATEGLLGVDVTHRVSKHLQQVIESDDFRLKLMVP